MVFFIIVGYNKSGLTIMKIKLKVPQSWQQLIQSSLKSDSVEERKLALDFLGQQNSMSIEFIKDSMPLVLESVVHHDLQVRYFARKARNQILDLYPEIEPATESKPFKLKLKEGEVLTAQQILLHKLRLGSRYLVFEAMERLTESGDISLVTPLAHYLDEEKDEYKISHLIGLLHRINDERIPELLKEWLDHEDPRIVANALESLSQFETPDLAEQLIDFATSSDNRIRANAVRGLYRYEPNLAERHIEEMICSNNVALQDSGVYLLRVLRPSNLKMLLDIAQRSRYATVRLKTLDIEPPTPEEQEAALLQKLEDQELPDPKRDLMLMALFLGIGTILLFIVDSNNRHLLSMLFLVVAAITVWMHEKTRTSIQKTAISMGFVSSLAWGYTRLMVLPGLMGIWLTWNSGRTGPDGKPQKAPPGNIYAWFFAVGAILLTQIIHDKFSIILAATSQLLEVDPQNITKPVLNIVNRQNRIEIFTFALISAMTIIIMKFNQWYPPKTSDTNPNKRLLTTTLVCLMIVALVNLFHIWGLSFQMHLSGLTTPAELLKQLVK